MTLSHYYLSEPINIGEKIAVLTIENPIVYRNTIQHLLAHVNGCDGGFVLSDEKYDKIDMSKCVDIITDPINLGQDNKKLSTALNKYLSQLVTNELEEDVLQTFAILNTLANKVALCSDFCISHDILEDTSSLIKYFSFYLDFADFSFAERTLEYMRVMSKLSKVQLFIFVGIKGLLSIDELHLLYKSILYEGYNVLLIENIDRDHINEYETNRIIDIDLCEI